MPEVKRLLARVTRSLAAFASLFRVPQGLARYARHGLAWVPLMVAAAWMLAPLKPLDWALVNLLDRADAPWPKKVEIVDLAWDMNPAGLQDFRLRIAASLQALAALPEPPRLVVVDVTLSTVPLALDPLREAVGALKKRGVGVVAVGDLSPFVPGVDRTEGLRRQGRGPEIYGGATFGHTYLEFFPGTNIHWYRLCMALPGLPDKDCLEAVPWLVGQLFGSGSAGGSRPSPRAEPVLFQAGEKDTWQDHAWRLQGPGTLVPLKGDRPTRELAHAVVIVGNPQTDRLNGRAGPELLAWAIGANIAPSPPDAPRLVALTQWYWTAGFAVGFSVWTLVVFLLIRRTLERPERHLVALAVATFALALGSLAAWLAVLRYGMFVIYPQVSYVVLGMALTVVLAWRALRAELRDRAMYTDVNAPPGREAKQYDVFISYSHTPAENMAWVKEQLHKPLSQALLGDRKLEIFFDTDSIQFGTSWYFEIAYAIQNSRCVVAVYSSDYFQKNFCKFEMGKAVVRDIAVNYKDKDRLKGPAEGGPGGDGFFILPLMRGTVPVPNDFNHLQFEAASDSKTMVKLVLDRLRAQQKS